MYNLIEYSSNYSETTGSLWFYSKDETTDFNTDIANDNNFKSFKYKVKLLEIKLTLKLMDKWNSKKCNNCCAIRTFRSFLEIT